MAWTESRVADLRKLWAEGLSGGEIALKFKTTRSAVLGKVHKLGLPKRITRVRCTHGSGAATRSIPREAPPPRKAAIPVALSVPMKAKARTEELKIKFDASPASLAAMALIGQAHIAQARRDGFRASTVR